MKRLTLKSTIVLACICFALNTAGLTAQGLGPFSGNLNPCPGTTEEYGISCQYLYCSQTEYEITVTPLDVNGNVVTLGYEIGVPQLLWRNTQNGPAGSDVVGYGFTVNWQAPPSSQFRWARICFRARCYQMSPGGSFTGPDWYERCVIVEIKTIDPVTITGPSQFECCATEPLTFCASPSNHPSYQWTVPSGWTVQGPSDKACITVIPNGSGGTVTAKPYHSACSRWGLPTSYSVTSTTCTRATIDVLQPVQCTASASGSIRVNPPSGFTISSITWRDQNGNIVNQGQTTLTGLTPGTYTAEMVLNNGCTALESITLTGPQDDAALNLSFDISRYDASSWEGESDCVFHIQAFPSGGLAPYTTEWSGYPSNDDLWYLNADGPRNVILTITDARGCKYTKSVAVPDCPEISNNDIAELTASPNPHHGVFTANVQTTNSGTLDLKVFNTMNVAVYSNSVGSVSSGTHQYQVDISNKPSGTYFLTATLNGVNPVTVQVVKQ